MHHQKTVLQEHFYTELPTPLTTAAQQYTTTQDKELALFTTLATMACLMENYTGTYSGTKIYPNLQCFVVNNSNKMSMPLHHSWAHAQYLDEEHLALYEHDKKYYPDDLKTYKEELKFYRKGLIKTAPIAPDEPYNKQFLAPVWLNHTAMLHLLSERKGKLTLHQLQEEKITIPYQQLSTLLHSSFYNLPYQHYIAATQKNLHIPHLQLSTFCAGSYEVLQQTVPNRDSIISEQLCYYIANAEDGDFNPFANSTMDDTQLKQYHKHLEWIMDQLYVGEERVYALQEAEQRTFTELFDNSTYTTQEAMICYRIMMILALLNEYERSKLNNIYTIYGTAEELKQAMILTRWLSGHRKEVMNYLEEHGVEPATSATTIELSADLTEEELLACNLQEQGMSLRKIAIEMYDDEGKFMKVKRMLERVGRIAA